MAVLAVIGVRRVAGAGEVGPAGAGRRRGDDDRAVLRRPSDPRADGAGRRRLRRGRRWSRSPGSASNPWRTRRHEAAARVPTGARRCAGRRRGDGAAVPRRGGLDARRLHRRVGVLHAVRLPDHEPAPRRVERHRLGPRRRVPQPVAPAGCCRPASCASSVSPSARGTGCSTAWPTSNAICSAPRSRCRTGCCSHPASSYTEVLATVGGQRSPLEHYWSLAIEEQFYWMWPLVFGWLATRHRDRPARAGSRG